MLNNFKGLRSVKFQMLLTYFIIGILPLLFYSFNISKTLKVFFEEKNTKEILYETNKIAGLVQRADVLEGNNDFSELIKELNEKSEEENIRIIVVDKNAIVLADTNSTANGKIYIVPEILTALAGRDEARLKKEEEAIYASAYVENSESEKIGAVLVISSFTEFNTLISEINQKWIAVTVVIGVIVIFLVVFMSQLIFGPLKNILGTITKISSGQLHQRIELKGYNEFTELGDAINQMTQRLEEVDKTRQEFVSNVSHELKTPLSSIKVLSEALLLQENVPVETYKEFLHDITTEVDRMTNITNDLLELVKVENGNNSLKISEFDINIMLRGIVKRLKPLADNKDISLSFEASKDVIIEADEVKLSLAISNLVDNGIKYTPNEGSVRVLIDADNQNCIISIKDSGVGISKSEQSRIFERFYRVDKTRDRETGGTGLGLAITNSTILMHNGTVSIESVEGEGTTFIVKLPLKRKIKAGELYEKV